MNKVFCVFCRDMEEFTILERETTEEIDGKNVTFIEEYAVCNTCNNEIYVGKLHDRNLEKVNKILMK